jgi:hypothetical protein
MGGSYGGMVQIWVVLVVITLIVGAARKSHMKRTVKNDKLERDYKEVVERKRLEAMMRKKMDDK